MTKILIEHQGGHGAIHHPIKRWFHKKWNILRGRKIARGINTVDWTKGSRFRDLIAGKIPIKNQGTDSSCGGQAGSYFLQIQRLIQGIDEGEISAKSIYSKIYYKGGGTDSTRLMNLIATVGANLEKDVPSYNQNRFSLGEAAMEDTSWQTPALTQDALKRAGYTPWDMDNDIETVAYVIDTYGCAMWIIDGQNENIPSWTSPTPSVPQKNNKNPIWHHFMCAYDFEIDKDGRKRIIAFQSEGPTWGNGGTQYFYEDYFDSGDIDAITCIYDANITPIPTNHSFYAELIRWFRSLPWFKTLISP